jgi:TldD protein
LPTGSPGAAIETAGLAAMPENGAAGELIDASLAQRLIEVALGSGGDFAELFVERVEDFTLVLDDQKVENARRGFDLGASMRVIAGESTHFGHIDGIREDELEQLARDLAAAVKHRRSRVAPIGALRVATPQQILRPPGEIEAARKAEILRQCDERSRTTDGRVSQVTASYGEVRRRIQVANSDGANASDDRTRVRLGVQVVARSEGQVETGVESLAGHAGFELFDGDPARVADEATRRALTMLDAAAAPAGPMAVVVGNGFGGVLFHEATGHGLESDAVQKGASVYSGRVGEKLAPGIVTAYDDGLMPGEWGTNGIDDEGTPCQSTCVIENGELRGYLYDLRRAGKDGSDSTGNGRRQSFRHLPIPRMTNTYIAPTETDPADIIADTAKGLYAASFAGGQVEPATGDFVFGLSEGYLIENGKLTTPVRGATLVGNGLDVLKRIDAIGNDLAMKSGTCGKDGQAAPVGTGQPTVRISELTVGGTDV